MKRKPADLNWLPPAEEWDFRSVTPSECRVACHWEYARQIRKAMLPNPRGPTLPLAEKTMHNGYCPAIYRQAAKELFPQAWCTLTKEQRVKVLDSFYAIPSLQVRKLGDFLKRVQGASPEVRRAYGEHSYVVQASFSLHGVEAVVKEFEIWARKEAKQHGPSPRAKAAEPPFDALKWLAVLRLEEARRKTGMKIENAMESLEAYRLRYPQTDTNDVFPIYASHGAWSKARGDAERLQSKVLTGSSRLLAGLA